MNYDNWKLSSPNYSDDVSTCCGAEYEETEEFYDTFGTEYICKECECYCEIQDEDDYKQDRWESYQEDLADDKRKGL